MAIGDNSTISRMQSLASVGSRAARTSWTCPSCCARARKETTRRWAHTFGVAQPGVVADEEQFIAAQRAKRRTKVAYADEHYAADLQTDLAAETHEQRYGVTDSLRLRKRRPATTPFMAFLATQSKSAPQTRSNTGNYGFTEALRRKDPEALIAALTQAAGDPAFLRSVPPATWTETVRLLDPERWLPRLHRIHRSQSETQLLQIGYEHRQKERRWFNAVDALTTARQRAGAEMTIVDYRLLLSYAATVGSGQSARDLWSSMRRADITPDVSCYNSLMEAIVWDEEARLRQTKRSGETMPPTLAKASDIQLWKSGISEEVEGLFKTMVESGLAPNTASYCAVLTALSRDGDITAVKAILQRVWGIEVRSRGSKTSNTADLAPPQPVSRTSPMYPDSRLLVTIAEIFGTHNEVATALGLVDAMARQYGIAVKDNTWYRLLMWTWLQARKPKPKATTGPTRRRLRQHTVSQLYNTMLSTKASSATIEKFHLLFRNRVGALRGEGGVRPLAEGRQLYVNSIEAYRRIRQKYQDALLRHPGHGQLRTRTQLGVQLQLARLRKQRDQQYLQRWVRIVLKQYISSNWILRPEFQGEIDNWRLRRIPGFLLRWSSFAPSRVRYMVDGGLVSLQFRTSEEVAANRARKPVADRRVYFSFKKKHGASPLGKRLVRLRGTRGARQGRRLLA